MKIQHFFLALLVNIAWGGNVVAVKIGLQDMTPVFFTFIRFLILTLILLPWLRIAKGQMLRILGISLTSGVMHFSTFFSSLHLTDHVSSIAVLLQLSVPFATLLAVIFLREHITYWRSFGIVASFCGAMIIGLDPVVFNYYNALILITLASLGYATGTVIARTLKDVDAMQTQAWLALISTPCLAILSYYFEGNQMASILSAGTSSWLALAYTVLAASILGHGGMYYLLKYYPVNVIAPFMLLTPVVGVSSSVILLGDQLTSRMIIGSLIILSGIALINIRLRKTK